jgi:hypothetical protein
VLLGPELHLFAGDFRRHFSVQDVPVRQAVFPQVPDVLPVAVGDVAVKGLAVLEQFGE